MSDSNQPLGLSLSEGLGADAGLCACMGPMYGERYCYCEMRARKLPLNELARADEDARSKAQMAKLFEPGGVFGPETHGFTPISELVELSDGTVMHKDEAPPEAPNARVQRA